MSLFHGLDREAYDREYSDRELLWRIADYFASRTRQVLIITVVIVAIAVVGAGQLFIISRGLDVLIRDREEAALVPVLALGAAVLAAGVFNWGGNWLRRRMTARIIGDVVRALRRD
ncbi:MAG: ABC transporter ATP-binding protein, partial [Anaerolineae bacterium]